MAISLRRSTIKRFLISIIFTSILLFISVLISFSIGSSGLSPIKVFLNIVGIERDEYVSKIVSLRVVRTCAAMLTGSLLGLSGLLMQTVTRNPLADPYILGLASTALTFEAIAILLNPSTLASRYMLIAIAFIGALTGYGITYSLSRIAGGTTLALVLAGIAVASLFSGVSHILLYILNALNRLPAPWYYLSMGSVVPVLGSEIIYLIIPLIVGFIVSLLLFKPLNLYIYGDSYVAQYGYKPSFVMSITTVIASLLTASATAIVGVVGFLGLAVPHIVRFFVGSDHRFTIPLTVIVGGIVALLSDVCVRLVAIYVKGLGELPLGIITSIIGAPFLAYLIVVRVRR
ncbi:transport system permease protein [Ignisphaera aggregans DSM 17230]|uniref:Transport system permease protein n=1 Tax=Ignisphaera aggregans (strain DSM 17230 / JCM 13409 / AQ1.S1) TaxID=583356 RepID=E0SSG4_IGNAA|nr:transport system permease protein [Ignisphaera aggregans DSM 17230]